MNVWMQKQSIERKIEGLAIRELPPGTDGRVRRELVIGLRQPDDLVRAFVADLTAPLPRTRNFLSRGSSPLMLASARAFAVSSRRWIIFPPGKAFWSSLPPRTSRMRFTATRFGSCPTTASPRGNSSPIQADKVWTFEAAMKAEGLCVLPPSGRRPIPAWSVLWSHFDNDPHATHIPSRFQQVNLIRRPAGTALRNTAHEQGAGKVKCQGRAVAMALPGVSGFNQAFRKAMASAVRLSRSSICSVLSKPMMKALTVPRPST